MYFKPAAVAVAVVIVSYSACALSDEGASSPFAPFETPNPVTSKAADSQNAIPYAAPSSAIPLSEPAPPSDPLALALDARSPASDLWQRIRGGFALADYDNPLVARRVARNEAWYARHPVYVERMTERSKRYLYFIVQEVEKRGMPSEIALLPMIESAFIPTALSRHKAAGIWQFVPGTGRKYGLEQDWWYDGRRDVIEATRAALDYLQSLYNLFGSWELALASYNCGEKKVARLLALNRAKGLPENYQSLKKLPRETRNYVPKLLAVRNIINDPAAYGLTLDAIPNQPYFTTVSAPSRIDVKLAAQLADVPLDEFVSLNPAHIRPVIKSETTTLLLPVDKAETFVENLENHDEPLTTWQTYIAKYGERLDKIAQHFGISLSQLKHVNSLRPRSKITSAGQMLLVPARGAPTLARQR
jgi:membrane-bound lytic murein transglycosylase D